MSVELEFSEFSISVLIWSNFPAIWQNNWRGRVRLPTWKYGPVYMELNPPAAGKNFENL